MAELTLTELGVPPGHGCISTLTAADGDFRLIWDPGDADEVANARQAFTDLRRDGYALYKVEGPARRRLRTVIREFDPAAGGLHVIATRPPVGG